MILSDASEAPQTTGPTSAATRFEGDFDDGQRFFFVKLD
jgi:hypothetical protein